MTFKPVPFSLNKKPPAWVYVLIAALVFTVLGYFAYRYLFSPESNRWKEYKAFNRDPAAFGEIMLLPGMRCGDSAFAFPTSGAVFGLWGQHYRPGHTHAGIDIFAGTEPGQTPVYAAYPGYLTRKADWVSTLIIRIPEDPLMPSRQIWTYYTHMADENGEVSFISADFPPGTTEVFVAAGTFLGYQGNFSGTPGSPTGLHLHFSVVKDDNHGNFLNELDIGNTYDPSPYFNIEFNHDNNPDQFPVCYQTIIFENWELKTNHDGF